MTLTGTIKKISDLQTFASGFEKRELVLLTEEQYPQPINIEFTQDKVDLLDSYKADDKVTVHINIRGREWTSPQGEVKYFNSIVGWRIEKAGDGTETSGKNVPTASAEEAFGSKNVFAEDDDDRDSLPF